jgi:serine/threonine protein kinase
MAKSPTSEAAAAGPLQAGTVLQKRYVIERLLGGGGMGMVYLAHDRRLANRACALKEMVDHFIDQQQRIEANDYFAREADTLAQLKHPAIPAISDRFDDQNRHYLVMEYVEGRNLEEELASRGGPLPEGLVIDIARQLCDVLAYLHGLTPPIIYRDMKPSNVMLTPKGRVVLIDFGIARLFRTARKGTMIGTLGFAPPEQYQGMVDPRSDIYSLGATLHYVVTARDPEKFPPFSFPPIRELRPDISSNLAGAIDRALSYEVDARPPSVLEFRDMMLYGRGLGAMGVGRVSAKSGTADLSPYSVPDIAPVRTRASRVRRAVGLALFLVALAGGAFGATYVYSNPELQAKLGVKPFIDSLPWKHEQLLAKAREHPLGFQRLTLQVSTRAGDALSAPKATFTDTELANSRYLRWNALFKNGLAGLEGRNNKVEARFYAPSGLQIASSTAERFVAPTQTDADFAAVALMPDPSSIGPGDYKVALYMDDQMLAEERFSVTEDLAARAAAAKAKAEAEAAAGAEEAKRRQAAERLAMIEERRRKPLEVLGISFLNTTKDGTVLSGPTSTFSVSRVLFVGWQADFENRLYGLDTDRYRVDAAYIAPDGSTLGSVDDVEVVNQTARRATFSGRVGNSAGGAFLPGQYTVNFYLNGKYLTQRKFRVVADTSAPLPYAVNPKGGAAGGGAILEGPTLATGRINGLGGKDNIGIELRLRPQTNGFLHGELVIHKAGYGVTPIEGFVRGDHLQFQVPYGAETLYFEGQRRRNQLSGTFEATPSGQRGTWTTVAN